MMSLPQSVLIKNMIKKKSITIIWIERAKTIKKEFALMYLDKK